MKKGKSSRVLLFTLIFTMLSTSFAFASNVNVYLENKKINMPVNPVLENGRTLVPLRAIFEEVGAEVGWDQKTRTVTIKKDGTIIKLGIGKKIAYVNGKPVSLEVPAKIIKGNTLVPVRFVTETLGVETDWDSSTYSVLLNSKAPYGKYKVTKVIDGDTIKIIYNGKEEIVKLIGVNASENLHPNAAIHNKQKQQAYNYTQKRLEGKFIGVEFDKEIRDEKGNLLGYVYNNGEMVNKVLLKEGYGKYGNHPYNKKYGNEFYQMQQQAKYNKKGFWGPGYNQYNPNRPAPIKPNPSKPNPAPVKPQPKPIPQKPGVIKNGMYIGRLDSNVFHRHGCILARNISYIDRIAFRNKMDAESQGYTPCTTCRPQ